MAGYLKAQRDRFKHPMFKAQKFCRGYAWDWMVAQASFKDRDIEQGGKIITLQRGQFTHSIRYMGDVFGWDKGAVSRFITRLKTEAMIETATETGQLIVTICNYEAYQGDENTNDTATGTATGTAARQQRDKEEERKRKEKKDKKENSPPASPSKGTRLSVDWVLPNTWGSWALEQGFAESDIRLEADKFRDYWIAVAGAKGVKRDWQATWRNWIRRNLDSAPSEMSEERKRWRRLAGKDEN